MSDADLSTIAQGIQALRGLVSGLAGEFREVRAEVQSLQAQVGGLRTQVSGVQTQVDDLTRRLGELGEGMQAQGERLTELDTKMAGQLDELRIEFHDQVGASRGGSDALVGRLDALAARLDSLDAKIDAQKAESQSEMREQAQRWERTRWELLADRDLWQSRGPAVYHSGSTSITGSGVHAPNQRGYRGDE